MGTRSCVMILVTAAVVSAGCAPPASGRMYSRNEARVAWNVRYGEVMAVDEAVIEGRRTALGRIGGGLIGYEAGRAAGSRVSGAVGAVAGAVAGEAVEEHATRKDAWQITVELEGGRTIAVVQARDESFRVGERVRVYMRRDGAARIGKV